MESSLTFIVQHRYPAAQQVFVKPPGGYWRIFSMNRFYDAVFLAQLRLAAAGRRRPRNKKLVRRDDEPDSGVERAISRPSP